MLSALRTNNNLSILTTGKNPNKLPELHAFVSEAAENGKNPNKMCRLCRYAHEAQKPVKYCDKIV
jgi:hypothetical protein